MYRVIEITVDGKRRVPVSDVSQETALTAAEMLEETRGHTGSKFLVRRRDEN